ncbi:MAG: universal stress protein [Reichenbachiella sp.]|uniref:universal stress protein n=2 Tax=Reichenbachiella sp. TaxID=2184521 RepID=UPI0032668014
MKKILVLTDFSDSAQNAAQMAVQIAKKIDAEILFLHCTEVPIDWLTMTEGNKAIYTDVKEKVNNIHGELNALVKIADQEGIEAKHSVGFNKDTTHLNEYMEKNEIDLVVMGSTGAYGLKELFSGSNSQQVVRHSEVPVLIIKEPLDISNMQIVFVSDFEAEILPPFKKMVTLAKALDAKIHLIHVDIGEFGMHIWQVEKNMQAFVSAAGEQFADTFVVHAFNVEEGVDKYCEKKEGAIICMATHGRTGISRLIKGSLTEQLVKHLDVSLISLHI